MPSDSRESLLSTCGASAQNRLKSLYTALENHDIESAVEFMKLVIAGAQDDLLNAR